MRNGFEFQHRQADGYTELIAEHQLVVDWIERHPGRGFADYLDRRTIDRDRKAAAYYIRGWGMGHGRQFALVQGGGLVIFSATEPDTSTGERLVLISSVEIPEAFHARRDHFRTLMLDACRCHFTRNGTGRPSAHDIRFEFDDQPWRIVPTRYSKRYWADKAHKLKVAATPKALAVWRSLTSPLASAVALVAVVGLSFSQVRIPLPAVLLVSCWFWWRFSRYDDDLVLGHWLVGRTRLKNPLSVYKTLSRLMEPQPLHAFKVTLTRPHPSRPGCFTLKVLNTSWYPASYFSISAKEVADLVAPGFTDALRAANSGAINPKALHAVFSDLSRRGLLPRQTVEWHAKAQAEFPLPIESPATHVVATVAISRRVSGEPKHGPQSFRLPVEILDR